MNKQNQNPDTTKLDAAHDTFLELEGAVIEQATGLRDRAAAGLPEAITELLEAFEAYINLSNQNLSNQNGVEFDASIKSN
tara:strand:+ start:206 stop:445 length:240 start_codon:yes stop_codon:yes gene_type:complete